MDIDRQTHEAALVKITKNSTPVNVTTVMDAADTFAGKDGELSEDWLKKVNIALAENWSERSQKRAAINALACRALTLNEIVDVNHEEWRHWSRAIRGAF